MCALILNYITTLPAFPGSGFILQAEESLLQLHQLTPQGVFLSQDSGDHGLGFISGQVRLKGRNTGTPPLFTRAGRESEEFTPRVGEGTPA